MKREDKQLLIEDLCARLSYGVKISVEDKVETLQGINIPDNIVEYDSFLTSDIEEVRPYLFPMSSMTEEQREEFLNMQSIDQQNLAVNDFFRRQIFHDEMPTIALYKHINWLIKNHFDYRGLIEKGLAIDATGKNIY